MVHQKTIRELALELRKGGHSYSYISQKTGISKSTLSDWLSTLPYKPNKITIERIGKARSASGLVKSKQKIDSIIKAKEEARKNIGQISKRDLFMLGIGIYIGEGTKTNNQIRIINADPRIIRFAIKWLECICSLTKENFRIRLHLYPDTNQKESIKYWSYYTGVKVTNFQKSQIDTRLNKKKNKKGKLKYGTAHLSIVSNGKKELGVNLTRRIMGWMEEVLK